LLIAPLAVDTYLLNLGVSGDSILGIFARGKRFYLLHLTPSTWGNPTRGSRPISEHDGTPVHITITDHTRYLLPVLIS